MGCCNSDRVGGVGGILGEGSSLLFFFLLLVVIFCSCNNGIDITR